MAKHPYGENSLRRIFLRKNFLTANFPTLNFHKEKILTADFSGHCQFRILFYAIYAKRVDEPYYRISILYILCMQNKPRSFLFTGFFLEIPILHAWAAVRLIFYLKGMQVVYMKASPATFYAK